MVREDSSSRIAQVRSIRSLDSKHVYLRVAWFMHPEELGVLHRSPSVNHELIMTNDMSIVASSKVGEQVVVTYWKIDEPTPSVFAAGQFFCRQTYNIRPKSLGM